MAPAGAALDRPALMYFGEKYELWSSSLYRFLRPPVASYLLEPNILSNLFQNCQSVLTMRDHVSHPYKTAGRNIVVQVEKEDGKPKRTELNACKDAG
jgi:hypothetical protein